MTQAVQEGSEIAGLDDQAPGLLEPLTEREQEVLQQMAFGRRNAEIAELLSVLEGTVKTHIRTQAVVMAIRQRIVR